jgi:hypothetical protein
MMSFRLAVVAILLTGTSASMLVDPQGRALHELATRVANDVTARVSENTARRLQSWDEDSFRDQVCDPFKEGFFSTAPPGSDCQCLASSFTIACQAPQNCAPIDDCDGEVCVTPVISVDFTERGTQLILTSVALQSDWTGADYQGERALVTESTCQQFFTYSDGLEYECNTCEICADGEGVKLDCSNIQPDAVLSDCLDTTDVLADESVFFRFCTEGDAPQPTTTGMTPVNLFSGAAATLFAVTFALVPAAAFLLL